MWTAALLLILIAFPALVSAQPSREQTPAPPSSVIVKRGDGTLTASWSAVPGATHYHVTYSDSGGASWNLASLGHTSTSIVISGVRNEASYIVGVRARTAQGWTGWTNSAVVKPQRPQQPLTPPGFIPPPNQPPRPVLRVDVTRADGTLTASWGASPTATAYDVTYTDDDRQSWQSAALDYTGTSITIDVDNSETYIVGVRAENEHGASSWTNSAAAGPWTPPPPNTPTGLIAVAGEDSATMQWNDPGDASITGYRYQMREAGGDWGEQTPIEGGGASTTSHQISGLAQGTTYHINLQALNAGGASAAAQTQAVLPGLVPGPANITVTRGTGTITVSWDAMPGAYRYWVASFNHSDGYSNREHFKTPTSTSTTLTGANDSLNYMIRIYARGDFGKSAFSWSGPAGTLTSPPLAPSWVSVTRSAPAGPLTASWPAVVGAASYDVNISGDRGKTWARQVGGHTGTSWTIAVVDADTDYIIAVRTNNTAGASSWTRSPVNTPAPPPPASVSVASRSGTALSVTWDAVTDATSYDVRSSTDSGATWATDVTGHPATNVTLTIDATKDYLIGVRAVNSKGVSGWTVSALSRATPIPPAPTNVSDTRGKGTIRLTWDASAGATSYEVACNPYESAWLWTSCATGITDTNRVASFSTYYNWVTKQNTTIGDDRAYLYAVRAKNASGASEWTRYTAWPAEPHRIASISATRSASEITLSWTVPAANGGYPIKRMDVQCRTSSDGGTTWSSWFHCGDQSTLNPSAGSTFTTAVDSQDSYDSTLTYQARARGVTELGFSGQWRESAVIDPFPILTASAITATGATLTLTGRTGNWWLKQTSPSAGTCTAGEADFSHALSTLSAGTWRTYTAYSDSSCSTELAAEAFSSAVTVSNLGETGSGVLNIGSYGGALYDGAQAFTTGSNGGGYTLSSITIAADAKVLNPANFVVKLHAATSTGKGAELATLSGSNPNENKNYTYACSGSGCALAANTTYYVFMEAPNSPSLSNYYAIWTTSSDNETQEPSSNGWSIANNGLKNGAANGALSSRIKVTALLRPSLTASSITQTTATLTLAGPVANWWLKETSPSTGTCTAGESDFSHTLSSLSGGTSYTYKAYSASGCATADEIASMTFTTDPPTLTASENTTTGATLTLTGHTGNWWLKETAPSTGSCTAGEVDLSHALSSLTSGTWHTYKAYSDASCSSGNELAAEIFATAVSVDNLSASSTGSGAAVGDIGGSDYQRAIAFTTGSVSSGYTLTGVTINFGNKNGNPTSVSADIYTSSSGGNPGSLVANLGSKSPAGAGNQTWTCSGAGCALQPKTTYLVLLRATAPSGSYYRWHRTTSGAETNTPSDAGWSIADVARYKTSQIGWTAYSGLSQKIKVAALPNPSLDASSVTNKTATLTMAGRLGNWYYQADVGPHSTCQGPVSTTTKALSGLTPGATYNYKAYSNSTCTTGNLLATAPAFTTLSPTLTATNITLNSATLTIADHVGNWYVKRTAPTAGTCSSAISGDTHNISTLDAGAWYTYWAYSDSSCTSGNELAGEVLGAAVSVDNLSAGSNVGNGAAIGTVGGTTYEGAIAFTTGGVPTGYTLSEVTVNFGNKNGDPTSVSAGVYTNNSGNPGSLVVGLGSKSPAGAGNQIWTCSGAGCTLSPSTTYLVVLKATTSGGTNHYRWHRTSSDAETNTPTGAGWSIAHDGRQKTSATNSWLAQTGLSRRVKVTALPNPSLTSSSVTGKTAILTLTGRLGAWYYQADVGPHTSCQGPVSASTQTLTGLTGATTYTYKAYSDSTCTTGNLLATAPAFTTLLLTLTADDVTVNSATLRITNHTGSWYLKQTAPTAGTCSSEITATTHDLSTLTAGTWYTYRAYSDSGCSSANELVAGAFATAVSVDNLSVGSNIGNGAIVGNSSNTDYQRAIAFTTGGSSGGYTLSEVTINFGPKQGNPTSVSAGVYTNSGGNPGSLVADLGSKSPAGAGNQIWSCSGSCALSPNTTYLVALKATAPGGTDHYRWHRTASDDEVNTPSGAGWSIANDGRQKTTQANWSVFPGYAVRIEVTAVPEPSLDASGITKSTATLTLAGHVDNWWLKQTAPTPAGACTAGEADFSHALSTLAAGTTYTYQAYSDSACTTAKQIASATFSTPIVLTSSGVTATTATLTLEGHSGNWYYQADAAPDNSCTGPVSGTTKALTALSPGTTYTYKAYSDATCTTANLLTTASAFSTPASLTASEITKTTATLTLAGRTGNWWLKKTAPTPAGTCTAGEADFSHALSTLVKNTNYTYKAYSASTCATTNELVTVSFLTTGDPGDGDTGSDFGRNENKNTYGLWSDGTTIWTADFIRQKLSAYTLAGGARDATKEFSLHADNVNTADLWSDGTTIWTADSADNKLYAYTLAGGARDTAKEFTTHSDNALPYGIWSDGTTIWVADYTDAKLYAYTLAGGARDTAKEFNLHSANGTPTGIWSDGTTIWVADWTDKVLYAYTLATGARVGTKDINLRASNGNPTSIWSDGTRIWVLANGVDKIHVYYMHAPTKQLIASSVAPTSAALDITWHDEAWWYQRTAPTGDSTCHSVAAGTTSVSLSSLSTDTSYTYKAYDKTGCASADEIATASFSTLATGERDTSSEFDTHSENAQLVGIWSNDTTMWALDFIDEKLYAYSLATGVRDSAKEFDLHSVNDNPHGLWSNGTTVWTSDDSDNKVYAYTLATGARDATKDISLHADNDTPYSLWSNGATIWVLDTVDDKLYAYTLATGARDASKDVSLAAVNDSPRGLWSDGTTIWVADYGDDKLYAYTLATGARDTTREIELHADNGNPTDLWSDGVTMWVSDYADGRLYSYAYAYTSSLAKGLTASAVAKTTATLNIANHTAAWWYQRTAPTGDSTCHSVAASTTGVSLSSLIRNTAYTYQAYSRSGCTSAYEIATASFTTVGNPGDHHAAKDLGVTSTNNNPAGLWSDGTTMWVADSGSDKLYAYTLASGARDTTKEFNLDSGNNDPTGLWSNGTTMWVADSRDEKLYAYTLATGARDTSKEFNLDSANRGPYDLWSDGTTMWVVDVIDGKLYAYTLATGARDTSKEFTLNSANGNPIGIWSDETTIWVVDNSDKKLYAYTLATGARDTSKEFNTSSANANPTQTWSDGATTWVIDLTDDKLYAYYSQPPTKRLTTSDVTVRGATLNITWHTAAWWYQRSAGSPADSTCHSVAAATSSATLSGLIDNTSYTYKAYDKSGCASADQIATGSFTTLAHGAGATASEINLDSTNSDVVDIWSDGTTIWVADDGDNKLFAYTLASGARDTSKEFNLHSLNSDPAGIWSNGTHVWVLDYGDNKLFVYNLASGSRSAFREFPLVANNNVPRGLWSDGTTIWVSDYTDNKLYAYTLASGGRDSAKDRNMATDNDGPTGIWSDGTTVWVSDYKDAKLFAYSLTTRARDEAREFNTHTDNARPGGLWWDGSTIWVADYEDAKLYAYHVSTRLAASSVAATTATLNIGGHSGAWYYKANAAPDNSCTGPVSGTTKALTGLTTGTTYTYQAYSDSTCTAANLLAIAGAFTPTSLGASSVSVTKATLTVTGDGAAWWYQRTTPTGDSTCHSVAASTTTAALTGLSGGTSYTYRAYNQSGCAGADQIATVSFSTHALGARDTSKEFGLASLFPAGAWSNGTTMWVSDFNQDKLYAYTLAGGARDTSKEFNLPSNNGDAYGLWSNGTTIWVADPNDDKLYAYTLAGGARDTAKEFNLHSDNGDAYGLWSNGTTVWVADNGDNKLFAYTLSGGARDTAKEFNLHSDNGDAYGIWSDGATIWVADRGDDKLFAYTLASGARDTSKEFSLNSANSDPYDIWSDGTTIWVVDFGDKRLYAYWLD